MPLEKCANCQRIIGKLETPHYWREEVVCQECRNRLEASQFGLNSTRPEEISPDLQKGMGKIVDKSQDQYIFEKIPKKERRSWEVPNGVILATGVLLLLVALCLAWKGIPGVQALVSLSGVAFVFWILGKIISRK